jgi:hypothetical protein
MYSSGRLGTGLTLDNQGDDPELSCCVFKLLIEIRQEAVGRRQEEKSNMQFRFKTAYLTHSL